MIAKELLYVEDALSHEKYLQTALFFSPFIIKVNHKNFEKIADASALFVLCKPLNPRLEFEP